MDKSRYSRYFVYIKPVISHPIVRSVAPYIFSLLAITFFIVFVIKPTLSTITQLQKNIEESRLVLQQLEKKIEDLGTGRKNYDSIDPAIKQKIDQAIPSQPEVPTLVANLRQATVAGSSISAIQIQPVVLFDTNSQTKKVNLGTLTFSFNIQGNFTELVTTLYNLSKSPRLFNIDSAVISKQEDEKPVLSITGKAFYTK